MSASGCRAFPPLASHMEKKKRENRYAKPILSVPTPLSSTHRARLAPPPTCTGSTCLQPRRLPKPIPSVPASLSSTLWCNDSPCLPRAQDLPSTNLAGPLHLRSAHHQLTPTPRPAPAATTKKQAIETMKGHLMQQRGKNCCNK